VVGLASLLAAAAVAAGPSFHLTSTAFANNGTIPKRYTCDGSNVSPPLRWTRPPRGAKGMALEVTDTDAADNTTAWYFIHWTGWGFAPRAGSLAEGKSPPAYGLNSFGRLGYAGPCPPPGQKPHHYVFALYALRVVPHLARGATWTVFYGTLIRKHVVAVTYLTGIYGR
jgi:Raf kinase inhibitor-like YbhB/YbcL family protein